MNREEVTRQLQLARRVLAAAITASDGKDRLALIRALSAQLDALAEEME